MGDFFSNLLTRNVEALSNEGPVLRPRPLTPYETLPPQSSMDQTTEPDSAIPTPLTPAQPPERDVQASLDWLALLRNRVKEDAQPIHAARPIPTDALPERTQPAQAQAVSSSLPIVSQAQAALTVSPTPILHEIHPAPPSTILIPPALAFRPNVPESSILPVRPQLLENQSELNPASGTENKNASTSDGERAGIQPAVRNLPPLPSQPANTPSPAPIIHVSIGRIEVRALPTAPAAPAARQQGAAVMSLEEYLRRRDGGQR